MHELASATVWAERRANRFRVEIHKKFSIAFACLVFVLIGIPLGLRVRRGGLGIVSALSIGIFLVYWVSLVQGEKFADRGFLDPWIGMWAANILIGIVAVVFFTIVAVDLGHRYVPRMGRQVKRSATGG
jgi:lipopolysaccharide export system permease protein